MRNLNFKATLIVAVFIVGFVSAVCAVSRLAKVPSGYKAKVTCSEVFVAGREPSVVAATNFDNISPAFDWVRLKVHEDKRSIVASLAGLGRAEARYRDGVGCTLVGRNGLADVRVPAPNLDGNTPYEVSINADVQSALTALFDDRASTNPIHTRAVVVIQHGKIVAERYAPGFDKTRRQQSWSTAKGVLQALVGIAVRQGYLNLSDSALLPDWPDDDPRAAIRLKDLLQMASGLEFSEAYSNPNSHVDQMLFNQEDMGAYAARQKLENAPGTASKYSSGTTNILANILRASLSRNGVDYHAFPRRELFDKISMTSAIFEVDAAGNFVGSSYLYATPRDFARFGQLYLQNGRFDAEQILAQDWIEFTRQPAPKSAGKYGAHWSLNLGQSTLPGLPEDVIHLGGNDGQMIVVIPSKNAVIVRLGVTRPPATLEQDLYPHIAAIFNRL